MATNLLTNLVAGIILILIASVSCKQDPKTQVDSASPKDLLNENNPKPVESGYAKTGGLEIYYEVYGEGMPLVMIHGSYMNIPMNWSRFIPDLSKTHKVIVAEMQGHGRTRDIERDFSYESMADDVSGLLKHLNIDSADILGYSMGGGVAFQIAVRHPAQVRRLVVLSGAYAHDGWWPDAEAMYPTINAEMFEGTPIKTWYDSLSADPSHFPEFVKRVISIDLKPYNWSKEAKNIKVPVFLGMGDVDGLRYEHETELFRALGGGKMGDLHGMPRSRLAILPGTSHVGMLNRAGWLIPMINDFLQSDLSPTPATF